MTKKHIEFLVAVRINNQNEIYSFKTIKDKTAFIADLKKNNIEYLETCKENKKTCNIN